MELQKYLLKTECFKLSLKLCNCQHYLQDQMTAFYFNIQKLGSTFTLDYDSMYMYAMSIF